MKILIGTNNNNKLRQFRNIFKWFYKNVELLSLADLNIEDDVEEDSDNLLENAEKKAKYYGEKSNIPTLADDTGLFIDFLNGEPGVHTRRWNGSKMGDQELIDYTLEKTKNIPEGNRQAQLRAIVTIYYQGKYQNFEYQLKGTIPFKAHPDQEPGFPFRSVFFIPEINKYHIEMTKEENNQLDHRKHLVPAIKKYLKKIINY